MTERKKILYFVTEDWYFCSHRLQLARAAIAAGFEVTVVTNVDRHGARIQGAGCKLVPLPLVRRSMNPWREWFVLRRLISTYRHERPDVAHHVALKPVIYGSLAARLARVPVVVNALAGLGYLFSSQALRARLMRPLIQAIYCMVLRINRVATVLVQNPDDRDFLVRKSIVSPRAVTIIRGSGVDPAEFRITDEPVGVPVIVLPARQLWDKGVGEFVAAARRVRSAGVVARFVLVGDADPANPAAVPANKLEAWAAEGIVEWWGWQDDMQDVFARSHIVCLPSYREGLPKVLLEAAASSRPIVASDVPGCREIVRHEVNGLLVPVRDADRLSEALVRLIQDGGLRKQYGAEGRRIVEREFYTGIVVSATLDLYRRLMT
jgi:glycosyltransferase involved in cell wall biosynthesis